MLEFIWKPVVFLVRYRRTYILKNNNKFGIKASLYYNLYCEDKQDERERIELLIFSLTRLEKQQEFVVKQK